MPTLRDTLSLIPPSDPVPAWLLGPWPVGKRPFYLLPRHVPAFVLAQLGGAALATLLGGWLFAAGTPRPLILSTASAIHLPGTFRV